jgi:RimJ/RimL family protein N-acetyltransferase
MAPDRGACQHEVMFREATPADAAALRDLEREANLVGLGHVFPPERYPYPDDDVLARWALVLDEPGVDVLVRDADRGGVDVLAAYDDRSLRHLAVHPDLWGTGLATRVMAAVLHAMALRGTAVAELWCLEENHRARRLYQHLGWRPAEDRRPAPWPPHPTEMRYTRPVGRLDRSTGGPPPAARPDRSADR